MEGQGKAVKRRQCTTCSAGSARNGSATGPPDTVTTASGFPAACSALAGGERAARFTVTGGPCNAAMPVCAACVRPYLDQVELHSRVAHVVHAVGALLLHARLHQTDDT